MFLNNQSIIIYDSSDSIHNFYLQDGDVIYVNADAITKKVESNIIDNDVKELDAIIDENDVMLIMCMTKNRKLILHEISKDVRTYNIVGENLNPTISDIRIFGSKENLNVLYTLSDNRNENTYLIMHSKHLENGEWENSEVGRFYSDGILKNDIKFIIEEDGGYLGFLDYKNNGSCLRIRKYDGISWSQDIFTIRKDEMIYWFDMQKNDNVFEFTYSYKDEGQFAICYESYDLSNQKMIAHNILSNISNCMYPTFVRYKGQQWVSWVELDSVFSCRLFNEGREADGPYKWKDSQKTDFMRSKFSYNNEIIKDKLKLKCSYVLGSFPGYSLIGFGNVKGHAEAVAIKKKENESGGKLMDSMENMNLKQEAKKGNDEKQEEILKCTSDRLSDLEKRVENIENYLRRRNRSIFGRR